MTTTDTNLQQLVINTLTQAQFDGATKSADELYLVTDASTEISDVNGLQTALDSKVSDVKVNNVSVTSSGVANIPVSSNSVLGVVKPDGTSITVDANGVISSSGGGATALVDLTDVTITSPSDNQILKYNSTTQKWENGAGGSGSSTWGSITGTLSDQTDLQTALNAKVTGNNAITAGTHTKITYDTKGLITAGADLAESDVPNLHLSKITDVTATATEVNMLSGVSEYTANEVETLWGSIS